MHLHAESLHRHYAIRRLTAPTEVCPLNMRKHFEQAINKAKVHGFPVFAAALVALYQKTFAGELGADGG